MAVVLLRGASPAEEVYVSSKNLRGTKIGSTGARRAHDSPKVPKSTWMHQGYSFMLA